jgi:hypothetical protein
MHRYNSDPFAPEPDTVIWRYMEDWQFDDLLSPFSEHAELVPEKPGTTTRYCQPPGNLWFAHPSSFGHELEGTLPK